MAVSEFNPALYPSGLMFPLRLTNVVDWHGHIPFAFTLVDMFRPRSYVELGVYYGDSYCAFCQAIARWGLGSTCVGIDTFKGDEDTGEYGSEILDTLRTYHDPKYASFSRLLPSTFDEAVGGFEDGSIDLIHHDGMHSYEAVRHDFETWKPKLSTRGVYIIHDTELVHPKFGVRRFWDEVKHEYPHFLFPHSCGLGVLGVGVDHHPDSDLEPEMKSLFEAQDEPLGDYVRSFYSLLGDHTDMMFQWRRLLETAEASAEVTSEGGVGGTGSSI